MYLIIVIQSHLLYSEENLEILRQISFFTDKTL